MPQDITQNIKVEVTSSGIESTTTGLTKLNQEIQSCLKNAKELTSAFKNMGSAKIGTGFGSKIGQEFDTATKKAKVASQTIKDSINSINASSSLALASAHNTTGSQSSGGSTGKVSASGVGIRGSDVDQATKSTKNLSAAVEDLSDKTKTAGKEAKGAMFNFFRFRAIAVALLFGLAGLGSGLVRWYQLASDYAEANHLLYTNLADSMRDVADAEKTAELYALDLFGNATEQSIKTTEAVANTVNELREMQKALGIDPTNLNRTFATFYSMGNSAGMVSSELAKVSQGMTQLTYDMASLWDMPFEEVAGKLQSALAGNTTAVKSLGIDISRTAADAWLMANGIDATYNSLDRASKMIVIYNMLMENTTAAQGDLARSAMQPANMLRILGEQATIAARNLGGALFPILTQLIPIAVAIANALGQAATALSAFLGIKLGASYTESFDSWNDYMNGLGGSASAASADVAGASAAVASVGDAAGAAAAPISMLSDDMSSADAAMGSLGSGAESAIGLLDDFSGSMEDATSSASLLALDEPMNSLTDMSNTIQDISANPLTIDETHAVKPLDTVTGAAEDTLEALDEIKNFQLGFDELHVMPDVSDGSGGGGGGGGGGGAGGGGGGSGIVAIDPYPMEDSVLEQILAKAQEQLEALAAWIDSVFGEGTWEQIQKTVNQVIDSIVTNFARLMESAGNLLQAFINLFDWVDLIKGFGDGFTTVLGIITTLVTTVMDLVAAFLGLEPVKDLFHALSYPIGLVLGAVAALAMVVLGAKAAFKLLSVTFSPLVGMFKVVAEPLRTIKDILTNIVKPIGVLTSAVSTLSGALVTIWKAIDAVATAFEVLVARINPVVAAISGVLGVAATFIARFKPIQSLAGQLGTIFGLIGSSIITLGTKISSVGGVFSTVGKAIGRFGIALAGLNPYVAIVVGVAAGLINAFELVYTSSETFRQTVSNAFQGIADTFSGVMSVIQPFIDLFVTKLSEISGVAIEIGSPIETLKGILEALKNVLVAILEPILTPLVNILGALGEACVVVAGIIGGTLMAALAGIVTVISAVMGVVEGLFEVFSGIGSVIAGVVTGNFALVTEGLNSIAEGITTIVTSIGDAIFSLIDTALTALGNALGVDLSSAAETAVEVLGTIVTFLGETFGAAVETAVSVWNGVVETLSTIWSNIVSVASAILGPIVGVVSAIFEGVASVASAIWNGIVGVISAHVQGVVTAVQIIWGTLSGIVQTIMNAVSQVIQNIWQAISDFMAPILEGIKGFVEDAWNFIQEITTAVFETVQSIAETVWQGIYDFIQPTVDTIKVAVETAWNAIQTITDTVFNAVKGVVDSVWGFISSIIGDKSSEASGNVDSNWNLIEQYTNAMKSLEDTVRNLFGNIANAIDEQMQNAVRFVQSAWDTINNILSSIGEAISGAVNTVVDFVSGASRSANSLASQASQAAQENAQSASPMSLMSAPPAPEVGWFATGGIFTKPSVIGLAEAGDEAVVPLSGPRMRPFAQAVAAELRVADRSSDMRRTNDADFINAVSTAVYNAMMAGFPTEFNGDVYMDSEKVGNALRKSERQRGVGTSLVRSF